jgi:hypothetical protein
MMIATASGPIHLGGSLHTTFPVVAVARRVWPAEAAPAASRGLDVSRAVRPWRWRTALMDVVEMLGVVWSLPLVVLLVGGPIALTIALLLWLGRLALGAF